MTSFISAIGDFSPNWSPGFRNRTSSSCPGAWPTCRGSQKNFKSPAFIWTKLGNTSRSVSVRIEIRARPSGKNRMVKGRDECVEVCHGPTDRKLVGSGGFLDGEHLLPGFKYAIADLFKEWDWD